MNDSLEAVLTEHFGGDTAAAILAGRASAAPKPLTPSNSRFFVQTNPITGEHEIIDTTQLAFDYDLDHATPAYKDGRYVVNDAASLIAYVTRHGITQTELWANVDGRKIIAIVDGHSTDNPGQARHQVHLDLKYTPAWKAWINGQGLGRQEAFAEMIESRQMDIVDPPAATLLELAQTFKATKNADFESSKRLTSGQTTLEYRETVAAKAGNKGDIDIPDTFALALAPFRGGPSFRVIARLRFRVGEGHLEIGYYLDNPDDVIEAAFAEIADTVRDGLPEHPMFNGSPS